MSKMTDYQAGREDGLLLAERIVKEGGVGSPGYTPSWQKKRLKKRQK